MFKSLFKIFSQFYFDARDFFDYMSFLHSLCTRKGMFAVRDSSLSKLQGLSLQAHADQLTGRQGEGAARPFLVLGVPGEGSLVASPGGIVF